MKQRVFFIGLFLLGLIVGASYFIDFLHTQHPSFGHTLHAHLILLALLAVIVELAAHVLRAYKSRLLLNSIRPAKSGTLFKGLSVGYLFNTLLPLRLGEIIRAFYVGDALAVSKAAVFISIVIERIVDGFILGSCFISAALIIHSRSDKAYLYLSRIGLGLIVLSLLLSFVIYAIRSEKPLVLRLVRSTSNVFNEQLSARIKFTAWSAIYGTKLMLAHKRALWKYFVLSLVMWFLYFCSIAIAVLAYFGAIAIAKIWFVTQTTYAGISAPAGPGYIGTFQIFVTKLLEKVGLMSAGGFSLVIWIILTVPISIIGITVLIMQRYEKKPKAAREHMLINKLYREHNISQELAHFLDSYFKGEKINQLLTQAELDDKFKLVKSFRGGSHAHTMLVWQDEEMRVKKIALPQYADKLEAQAKWLLERAGLPHLPTVLGQEKTETHYYFDLAYSQDFYPFFDYIHSHSSEDSSRLLSKVVRFMNKSIYKSGAVRKNKENVTQYIETKVLQKATDAASMSNVINKLMTQHKLIINGNQYDNLVQVVEKIKKNKKAMAVLTQYAESPIHGDLTIDNLIVNNKGDFLILDPNNENDVSTSLVDMGKLYQSLHSGYEFLIQLVDCSVKQNKINFEDNKSQKYAEIFLSFDEEMKKTLKPSEYQAILFHEAVHYCRMLTYRVSINPTTAPVFYATSVKLFNEFLRQFQR